MVKLWKPGDPPPEKDPLSIDLFDGVPPDSLRSQMIQRRNDHAMEKFSTKDRTPKGGDHA
jgi:hypothetical protein